MFGLRARWGGQFLSKCTPTRSARRSRSGSTTSQSAGSITLRPRCLGRSLSSSDTKNHHPQLFFNRTASGAWSIEGWGAPRVYHRGVELHDDQSISDAGIRPDSRLEPAYNSSAYSVLDPAYYGGSSQPMPLTKSPCGVAKDIGEHWEHGPGTSLPPLLSTTNSRPA